MERFQIFPDETVSEFPDETVSEFPDETVSEFPDETVSEFPDGTVSEFPDGTVSKQDPKKIAPKSHAGGNVDRAKRPRLPKLKDQAGRNLPSDEHWSGMLTFRGLTPHAR
jgi:hypothetical protein